MTDAPALVEPGLQPPNSGPYILITVSPSGGMNLQTSIENPVVFKGVIHEFLRVYDHKLNNSASMIVRP